METKGQEEIPRFATFENMAEEKAEISPLLDEKEPLDFNDFLESFKGDIESGKLNIHKEGYGH